MKMFTFRSHKNKCRLQLTSNEALLVWIGKKEITIPLKEVRSIFFSEVLREKHRIIHLHIEGSQKEFLAIQVHPSYVIRLHRWLLSVPSISTIVHACPKHLQPTKKLQRNVVFTILLTLLLVVLLFLVGKFVDSKPSTPALTNETSESSSEFDTLFKEGTQLIEENHLTAGIDLLLKAKKIKSTPEIDTILNEAYFERGEYFFQNNDFEKAIRDFEKMIVLNPKAQEMIDQMKITHSNVLPGIQVKEFQRQLRESYHLTFQDPTMVSTGNWVIDGKMFDDDTQSDLTCRLYLKNPYEVYRVVFQADATQSEKRPQDYAFDKLSANYLSFASTLFRTESDPVKASEWIVKTVPKAKLPYVQFDNVFVNTGFRLYGEQYKRVLEVFIVST
jgi:hypothetical protein